MSTCKRCKKNESGEYASCPDCREKIRGYNSKYTGHEEPKTDSILRAQNSELRRENERLRAETLTAERVRREFVKLTSAPYQPPEWLRPHGTGVGKHGTPVLFLSDQHLGEVVDPEQIGGVNSYNIKIAEKRWKGVVAETKHLLFDCLSGPDYPGIVVALGGDGISGDIHDELSETNEEGPIPSMLRLADMITWTVEELLRDFRRILIPGVIGNHPRLTKKPRNKNAFATSMDFGAYCIAAKRLEKNKNVAFLIPHGPDATFAVEGRRFLLTHGAQFRGGDGIIGPLGPVFRGDNKKRARNAQVGAPYDTMMVAHFHQLRIDRGLVMNGSLKGYDEFAFNNNFRYEPPQQALFMVHPKYGMTLNWPVLADLPFTDGVVNTTRNSAF